MCGLYCVNEMGVEGLEPSQFNESTDFKSVASTNSAIPPFLIQFFMYYYICSLAKYYIFYTIKIFKK